MLHEFLKTMVWMSPIDSTSFHSLTSSANIAEFHPVAPVRLFKWGIIAATAVESETASTKLTLYGLSYPGQTYSSGTAIDTLTLGANATSPYSVLAQGYGAYRDPWTVATSATTPASQVSGAGPEGDQGTFPIISGQQQMTLAPNTTSATGGAGFMTLGQALAFYVTTAADTQGTALCFVEYALLPINRPSGYGFTNNVDPDFSAQPGSVSLTENLTRYTS